MRDLIGAAAVLVDDDLTEKYRRDWTGRYMSDSAVVARPADEPQLAAVVALCASHGVAIVPQGGNTGLVGGSVPLGGELVVSTERLRGRTELNAATGFLTAAAGTPLATVQQHAHEAGWRYGVDIASRDSATIGGTVATNAGGLRAVRYGMTRAQVAGIAFVDGTGAFHSLPGAALRKNTGADINGLLCGSEGTYGIITAVRLRLVPDYPERTTALLRFDDPQNASVAAEALRGELGWIDAVELFFSSGLELVCRVFDYPPPFTQTRGGYVLVEVADTEDRTATLAEAVQSLAGLSDTAVASDPAGRARLWRYRERHTEAIATIGVPHKLDVAVPPGSLASFLDQLPAAIRAVDPDAQLWLFGHGGEASVHVNVTGLAPEDDAVDDAVLDLVVGMGGSISAEHGIGTAKRTRLNQIIDPAERALRQRVKAAFDPHGIMNPAVLTGR